MNKLLSLLLLCPVFVSAASKFRELPYEQKIKDERASFILTFDKKTTYADKARGTALSTLPNVDLMLRSYTGYDGRNAFSPAGSEKLEFPMLKNLDMRQGTLIMWVKCVYDIATCGNNGIFNALLSDGKNNTRMFIYLYKGGAHASWRSSLLKVSGRNIIHLSAPLKHIREGEWFQVALTWDRDHFKFYINGKLAAERDMPPRARQCQDLVLDPDESWIGFNTPNIWSSKNDQQTQIDDIRIYPEVLTPLELSNQYAALLLEKDDNFAPFILTATGIPERPYDKMELDFNFGNQLPAKVNYEINGPDGLKKSGVFSPSKSHEIVIVKGINRKGKYFLAVTADYQGNGGKKTLKLDVTRPDLEYLEDVSTFDPPKPPTPFLPVKIDAAGKSVEVWNRKIVFANGPLPTAITIKKQNLFIAPPVLTVNGKPIQWTDSKLTAVNPKMALLTGNGKGKGFGISYRTEIWFDGMIYPKFTITGKPEVKSLQINWTVAPGFRKYLMSKGLVKSGKISGTRFGEPDQIWLASEQGGFSWDAVDNANWRNNDNDSDKIINASLKDGKCSLSLISVKTQLPVDRFNISPGVFIATPTRPLPNKLRGFFLHTKRGMYWTHGTPEFRYGFTYNEKLWKKRWQGPTRYMLYGTMNSIWEDAFYNYFKKYIYSPGDYSYKMPIYTTPKIYGNLSPCRMDSEAYQEYRLNNLRRLLAHPLAKKIDMVYNDICSSRPVSNPVDIFTDDFGKPIKKYHLMSARKFIIRELEICRKAGKPLMLHAQYNYTPALQGMADYWYPGEQYQNIIQRKSGFIYTDEISDEVYDSEFNRNVMGVAIMFLPIGTCFKDHNRAHAEAMLTAILPHDIEFSFDCYGRLNRGYNIPHNKVWDTYTKYGVYEPGLKVCRFFEQKKIVSSNPKVRVTSYRNGKKLLLVIANKTRETQSSEIDLKKLGFGNSILREEYEEKDIRTVNGKIKITLPPRSFRLVGTLNTNSK